jgi:hypothetical protein
LDTWKNDFSCNTMRARTCTEPSQDIVVKFADRYGAAAHDALAAVGLAPKVLYCGPVCGKRGGPSYGGLTMVVMEYIEGQTVAALKEKAGMGKDLKEVVRSEVNRALDIPHRERSLVYGDLRGPNVMVTKDKMVKLIDFDWAGVQGQVRYPSLISDDHGKWVEGVVAGEPIQKEHDLAMLEKLLK